MLCLKSLIDISFAREDSTRASVYLDGPDARLFKALRSKLGSDQAVQNALILEGMLCKLEGSANVRKLEEIKTSFADIVGLSYPDFQKIVYSIS